MKKGLIVSGSVLLFVALLVVVVGVLYTLTLPNIYQSRATIAVTEEAPANPFAFSESQAPVYDPYFLRTQFELIQSEEVLNAVINRLNLQEEWGTAGQPLPREDTLVILKNSIRVVQHRDTSLISIICSRPIPHEAARIANEIAETYRDSRMDKERKQKAVMLEKMDEALREQTERVLEAERQVSGVRQYYIGSPDVHGAHLEQVKKDQIAVVRVLADTRGRLSKLQNLERLNQENLMEIASLFPDEQILSHLVERTKEIESKIDELDDEFGPNHPEVLRYINQQAQTEKAVRECLLSIRNRIRTEHDLAAHKNEQLSKLVEQLTEAEKSAAEQERDPAFRNAVANLESERTIYNQLNLRLQEEIVKLEAPRNLVEIVDPAVPMLRPVSPNLFLNIILSCVVAGVAAIPGVILLIVGICKGQRQRVPAEL